MAWRFDSRERRVRGAAVHDEAVGDSVPADHPVRSIRLMVNEARVRLDGLVFRRLGLEVGAASAMIS
ncbi:hypothetical protein CN238_33435 [Sinorhizobium meliloti]|nr:hypothetical protein CN238_33435 [Sinorhizobium meliloti]RVH19834.1 hypothetical protein CN214_33060 [Sinorhizobium meliloti]